MQLRHINRLASGAISALIGIPLLSACNVLYDSIGLRCSGNLSTTDLYNKVKPSLNVIQAGNSQGSGFVVEHKNGDSYILTNSHVVSENSEVVVKWENRLKDKGYVIGDLGGHELTKDLALIKVKGLRGQPLRLRDKAPEVGSDVIVVGAPQGLEFSLTKGIVSQLREKGDFVQIDAPVNPGNSGGPVIDSTGCVVGVVTFKKENAENLNFAISAPIAKKFSADPIIARLDSDEAIVKGKFKPFPQQHPNVPAFKYTDSGAGVWITYWELNNMEDIPESVKSTNNRLEEHNKWDLTKQFGKLEYQKDTIIVDGGWVWVLTRNPKTFEQWQQKRVGNEVALNIHGSHPGNTQLRGMHCQSGNIFLPKPWWWENLKLVLSYQYPDQEEREYDEHWRRRMGLVSWDEEDLEEGHWNHFIYSDFYLKINSQEEKEAAIARDLFFSRPDYNLFTTFCQGGQIKRDSLVLSQQEQKLSKASNQKVANEIEAHKSKVNQVTSLLKNHMKKSCADNKDEIKILISEHNKNYPKRSRVYRQFWNEVYRIHGKESSGASRTTEDFPEIAKKYPPITWYHQWLKRDKAMNAKIKIPNLKEVEELRWALPDKLKSLGEYTTYRSCKDWW